MKQRTCQAQIGLSGALLFFSGQSWQAASSQTSPIERLDPGYKTAEPPPAEEPSVDGATTSVAPVTAPPSLIAGIQFKGVDVPAPVAEASQAFLGRTADTETLKELAAAMTAAYRKSDVALFTLAIPQQDLSDGVVDVYLAEGHVAQVLTLRGRQPFELPRLTAYMSPVLEEKPASRATFERGLMLVRRAEGVTVSPRLQTVPEPGAVAILLDTEEKKNGFAFGYDSRKSQLVDSGRIGASAFAYSTVREGDALRGRLSATPDTEQARSASLQYTSPIGPDGLSLALGGAFQQTQPESVDLTGEASFLSAGLVYPVILDFRRELSVTADLDRTDSSNTALGSVIANERISAFRLGTKYSWSAARRSASLGVSYAHGLDFGESRTSVPGASPGFSKAGLSANALQVISPRVRLRLRGTAQWSGRSLPANERLPIGGADFGRGFDNALISFDRGYAIAVEPALRPISSGAFANSEVYLFADYADGMIAPDTLAERTFDLGSAGIGTRIVYKDMASFGLEIAEPWKLPADGMDDEPIVTVSWSFRYQR